MSTTSITETQSTPVQQEHISTSFWHLLGVLRKYPWMTLTTILSGILNHSTAIACSTLGAYLVSLAIGADSAVALYPLIWLMGGLVLLRAIMAWLEVWLAHDLAYRILAVLRGQLYWALERLAPGYLLEQRSGDLTTTAMSDVEMLEWFYAHTTGTMVIALVVSIAALATLASIHWLMMLALLPCLLFVITIPFWLNRHAYKQGQELRSRLGEVNAEVIDGVQGLRELVIFGQETNRLARLKRHNSTLGRVQFQHGIRAGFEGAMSNLGMALGMVCVLTTGAYLVSQQQLPTFLLPVGVILAASTFAPVVEATMIARSTGLIFAASKRVFKVLHAPPPVADTASQGPAGPVEAVVRFEQVSFRYQPALPDALKNVSFEIRPGKTVALVGHSGAGKSTSVHLLMRFWDVTEGAITIGGHDLRAFPLAELRDLMSLVPQDIYLFNTSIRENIRLGSPTASDEEVTEAARQALAHDFITALPNGYSTNVGERGLQLSGGQRQRIAIARALLKNAPILVMDEAVSNLDTENERLLQDALQCLRANRTTLVIAHRLSTIRAADTIVVLQNGAVAETGTHAQLLQRNGVYTHLVATQQNGLLPE
jgi:thiol reductant ABC exporter CydC subunit